MLRVAKWANRGMILEAVKSYPITVLGPRGVLVQEGQKTGKLYVLKSGDVEIVRDGSLVASIGEASARTARKGRANEKDMARKNRT